MPAFALWLAVLAWFAEPSIAQGPPGSEPRPWRLGVLAWHDSPNDQRALEGIRNGLKARARPHRLFLRDAEEDPARVPEILAEFRREGVELIFTLGTQATLLASRYESVTPIVFTAVTHPVRAEIVPGWDGSGRNLCGNSNWIAPETLVDVFGRAVPGLRRLGVLRSRDARAVSGLEVQGLRRFLEGEDAPELTIVEEVIDEPSELAAACRRLVEQSVDALWVPIDFPVYSNLEPIVEVARESSIPIVSSSLKAVERSAVVGAVVDYEMLGERAVVLAISVLEDGVDPGTIPIGTMRGYQVVVNLRAAEHLGVQLPLPLLATADRILGREQDDER